VGITAGINMLRYLESIQRDGKYYDIIHCQYGTIGRQFLLLKRFLPAKYVVTFRGFDLFIYGLRGEKYYGHLFDMADCIIANNKYTANQLIELGCPSNKIVEVRSASNLDRFQFKTRTIKSGTTLKMLTVARLVEVKGLEYAVKAVAKLAKDYPIKYEIVGEGILRPYLEKLINQLGLSNTVFLLGAQDREMVARLMREAHLFILPSVTLVNGRQDTGPGVLREALASGIPVVASNSGGIPYLVANGISGFLVPERDVDALAERLGFLIDHPEIWPEMGEAGRRFVEEHYDLKKQNNKLLEVYLNLVDNFAI
jgi:colanic acid/amylovoran biosynthesis glycosyltransferase